MPACCVWLKKNCCLLAWLLPNFSIVIVFEYGIESNIGQIPNMCWILFAEQIICPYLAPSLPPPPSPLHPKKTFSLLTCGYINILAIWSLCNDTFISQNISKVANSTRVKVVVTRQISSQQTQGSTDIYTCQPSHCHVDVPRPPDSRNISSHCHMGNHSFFKRIGFI